LYSSNHGKRLMIDPNYMSPFLLYSPYSSYTLSTVTLKALTPLLSDIGERLSKRFEKRSAFSHYLGQDRDVTEIKDSDDFVVVVGYGTVGKTVCDLLDRYERQQQMIFTFFVTVLFK
jgi:hypothetical protein